MAEYIATDSDHATATLVRAFTIIEGLSIKIIEGIGREGRGRVPVASSPVSW